MCPPVAPDHDRSPPGVARAPGGGGQEAGGDHHSHHLHQTDTQAGDLHPVQGRVEVSLQSEYK